MYDITIIGSSFSGLSLAHHLPKNYKVLIIDKKKNPSDHVESTGLITTATYELLKTFIKIDDFIPNQVTTIGVVSPNYDKHFFSHSKNPWIYTTDTQALIGHMSSILPKNVTLKTGSHFKTFKVSSGEYPVEINYSEKGQEKTVKTKILVGADGSHSKVAQENPNLSQNKKFLAGLEKVYFGDIHLGDHPKNTIYHFWFGEFSLGYGGWLSPTLIDGKHAFRVGLAKLEKDTHELKKLDEFIEILQKEKIITITNEKKCIYSFGSLIPIGGTLDSIYDSHTVLIGDAAGFCGAFAADGIKGSILSAKIMAKLIPKHLEGDKNAFDSYKSEMQKYHKLLTYYKKQVFYRWVWDRMKRDRTFHAMYDIIEAEKEGFLNQYCDSRGDGKGLTKVILKFKHIPKLIKYGFYILLDMILPYKRK